MTGSPGKLVLRYRKEKSVHIRYLVVVGNNTKDNKSLEGGYGKRRTSDKRGTGKRTSAEKKTTSENQSAGISGSDRLGTDRAGGWFYDREIFI